MADSTTQAPAAPVWMITGCSSGIGNALARVLLERGLRVVMTARDPGTLRELAAAYPRSALALRLDVTKAPDIEHAVLESQRTFGRIDVLVNNAGYGYYTPVEEGEDAAVRAMFEANFFGLVALIRAVLPSMRARRSGCIVNVSSIGGLVAHPGSGYYAASKFAVEAVSESLSKEIVPLGLRVLLVEPGPFRTNFVENIQGVSSTCSPDYADTAGAWAAAREASRGKQVGDPAKAAAAIIAAVESPTPPLRLVLGGKALEMVRGKLTTLVEDIDAWEAVSLATDYDDA